MILQEAINVEYFGVLRIFFPIMMCIFIFFSTIPLTKYLQTKSKVALYFAITNLIFTSLFVVMELGILDALDLGVKTDLYYFSVLYMNVGIIAASIFYYLFYALIVESPKKESTIIIIGGIAVIIFQLAIWPDWFGPASGGMQPKYIAWLLQTIFCVYVYIRMALQFLRLSKKVKERERELKAMGIGSVLIFIFFVFMLLRVIVMDMEIMNLIVQIVTWVIFLSSTISFFYGFILPNITRADEEE